MDTFAGFIDMGGYAAFVWPSYAVTAVVMAGLLISSRRALRANEAALEALRRQEDEKTEMRKKPLETQA